jgi:hypothetical protein
LTWIYRPEVSLEVLEEETHHHAVHLLSSAFRLFLCCPVSLLAFALLSPFIMIRFPATSIGLSQSDIDFHLQDIEIKEQLYAQGFTRQEVQRYYAERYGDVEDLSFDDDVCSTRTASTTFIRSKEERVIGAQAVIVTSPKRFPSSMSVFVGYHKISDQSTQMFLQLERYHLWKMRKLCENRRWRRRIPYRRLLYLYHRPHQSHSYLLPIGMRLSGKVPCFELCTMLAHNLQQLRAPPAEKTTCPLKTITEKKVRRNPWTFDNRQQQGLEYTDLEARLIRTSSLSRILLRLRTERLTIKVTALLSQDSLGHRMR